MLFSQAIQIKSWVNRFNQERNCGGFSVILFECEMYSIGHWSVVLKLSKKGVFFSHEMAHLCCLLGGGGLNFFVGSINDSPVLYFQ